MNKKQTSLESFFEKGERPNDETAEASKTANKKKAAFKRKYQESYLNYGFIATGEGKVQWGQSWQILGLSKLFT